MSCLTEQKADHLNLMKLIRRAWDKDSRLVKQFGKTSDPNNIAEFHISELLKERYSRMWDEDVFLSADVSKRQAIANDIIAEINKISDRVATSKISTFEAIMMPPDVVHNLLPSSRAFLNAMSEAKSYESTARENFQRGRNKVEELLLLGFEANGAGKVRFEDSFLKQLKDAEHRYAIAGSDSEKAQYLSKINRLMTSDKGKTLRDYMELVEMRNADFNNKDNVFKYNEYVYRAAEKTREMLGKMEKGPDGKTRATGLGKVMINSLDRQAEAVIFARTKQKKRNSIFVEKDKPLKNFLLKVEEAKTNIKESLKDGGYIPHMGLDQLLNLRKQMEGVDFSSISTQSDNSLDAASKILESNYTNRSAVAQIQGSLGTPAHSKQRSQSMENYFAQNPLFVLEKYANEVIMHNRDSKLKLEYLNTLKNLGDDHVSSEFISTMKKYLTMQYERAGTGTRSRPEWVTKTVQVLNSVEVLKSMGLGMAGAVRNLFSASYYLSSQVTNGNRKAKLLLNDNNYKAVIAEVESEQGFRFLEKGSVSGQGLDVVTEGALAEVGIRSLADIKIEMTDKGQAIFVHKGEGGAYQRFTDIQNKLIEKSLFMHRWGENKMRNHMFRTGFVTIYDSLVNNQLYMNKEGSNPQTQERNARKFATKIGLATVDKWAFNYSNFHKAPIISGIATGKGTAFDVKGSEGKGLGYTTALGSVVGLVLHYPMEFAALQPRTLKRAADKTMAGDLYNSDSKNVLAFAGVYGLAHAISLMFNSDLTHLMENDTIERMLNLIEYASEDDPEQLKYKRGIVNDFTGPIVQDIMFWGNVAGLYDMPDSEWGKMMLGYQDYYDMNNDEQQRAKWMKISTEIGKWKTKIVPALYEGRGIDNWLMQEFGLYPRSWTRSQRETVLTRGEELYEDISDANPLLQLASDIGRMRR